VSVNVKLCLVALLIGIAASCATAIAETKSPRESSSTLSCFSVTPEATTRDKKPKDYPTCDALCAEKSAACTGMQNGGMNPPVTCADPATSEYSICRCCVFAK